MKKTGLVIAATAAAVFVAGCSTQADTSSNMQPVPAPVAQPANACKGMSSCKGKTAVKKHHKKHHVAKQTTTAQTTETTTSETTAAAPSTDAATTK